MTDKEKLIKIKKLADAMYYAAQYLTTDASRLHKAMNEYHKFTIYECKEEPVSEQNLSNVERIRKNWKEEPVSEELEEACEQLSEDARKHKAETSSPFFSQTDYKQGVINGAKWQKEHLWKPADGDDLPEIDREVVALLGNGKVGFAHRPPEYWDGKDIITGKVTRNYVERYDKGLWNIPNVKYWLDINLPKQDD